MLSIPRGSNFKPKFPSIKGNSCWALHHLWKISLIWIWTNSHEDAFHKKKLLISDIVLGHNEKKPLILTTDVLSCSIASVLSHRLTDDMEAEIAYYSRIM